MFKKYTDSDQTDHSLHNFYTKLPDSKDYATDQADNQSVDCVQRHSRMLKPACPNTYGKSGITKVCFFYICFRKRHFLVVFILDFYFRQTEKENPRDKFQI